MHPTIDGTQFGSITVAGEVYDHDIVVRLSGKAKKRKKRLSKKKYGTSHTVSLKEAKNIFDDGAERLVVGAGQHGALKLSKEAEGYFKEKRCSVDVFPTPDSLRIWNEAEGKTIAMFRVTC